MASVYIKGARYWCRLKGLKAPGKWSSAPTEFKVGDVGAKRDAQRFADERQRIIDEKQALYIETKQTVVTYARRWLETRKGRELASVGDDIGRINNHVLPHLGPLVLATVRPRHVRDMVRALKKDPNLAPRTILNIYGITSAMFRDAVIEEAIAQNPCILPPGELPEKADKDPEWRDAATFTIAEVVQLCTDPRIPSERRVQYAMKALAGMRHGEVAGFRWRLRDTSAVPLGRLSIARSYNAKRTKTNVTRPVPEHPELARVLDIWWGDGWQETYGREPTPDDLVVPTRNMTPVSANDAVRYLKADLDTLGLRKDAGTERDRGGHDLRAWFITTCQEHGADIAALMLATHTKRRDVISGYTRLQWPSICAAVGKLRISLGEKPLLLAPGLATRSASASKRWRKVATPTGFEPVAATVHDNEEAPSSSNGEVLVTSCDVSMSLLVASACYRKNEDGDP
jgi:integrase